MNWAPCSAASWARCSCFWIIDSLSPVQLAWTSAPRTVRPITCVNSTDVPKRGEGTPLSALARALAEPRIAPPDGAGGGRNARPRPPAVRLVRERLRPSSHVPLGEFATAALPVEAADEDVREFAVDARAVVGQVACPAVGDMRVAIDREDLVIGLPGTQFVRIREPRVDYRLAPDDRLFERVEGVAHVRAEQVTDGDRIEESP